MADPNRLRVSDPVCEACGQQVKTIALEGGLYRCPACVLVAKGLPPVHRVTRTEGEQVWFLDSPGKGDGPS